jgi:hypothetical protein
MLLVTKSRRILRQSEGWLSKPNPCPIISYITNSDFISSIKEGQQMAQNSFGIQVICPHHPGRIENVLLITKMAVILDFLMDFLISMRSKIIINQIGFHFFLQGNMKCSDYGF